MIKLNQKRGAHLFSSNEGDGMFGFILTRASWVAYSQFLLSW